MPTPIDALAAIDTKRPPPSTTSDLLGLLAMTIVGWAVGTAGYLNVTSRTSHKPSREGAGERGREGVGERGREK